jgi:hypothetical protein
MVRWLEPPNGGPVNRGVAPPPEVALGRRASQSSQGHFDLTWAEIEP